MTATIDIGGRLVGPGEPVYIVAEMSANHNQSFDQAVELIRAAKDAGADAVKLQTYTAETLTLDSDREFFRVDGGTLWDGRTLFDLYGEAFTPWAWQPKLKDIASQLGLQLFSSPFDPTAVDFLETMNVPAHKIASFELVDLPLIRKVAATGKPIIMSTGMATLGEIEEAVDAVYEVAGRGNLALLKCTSAYPAPPEEMNLRCIHHLSETFDVPVGLSDHTLGIAVPIAAVALGATIIEKHFTLSRSVPGPDSAFSLEPDELRGMIDAVRIAEKSIGRVQYDIGQREQSSRSFRRSLFVVESVRAGQQFTAVNVRSIRPGDGLPPKYQSDVLKHYAAKDIPRGTPLAWHHLKSGPEGESA